MTNNLLHLIAQEKINYENEDIQIVEGYRFHAKSTIERIYRYHNSKFASGDIDSEGNKKYFYNVVRNPTKVVAKAIDFDTKHIMVLTAPGGDPYKTWLFERDLKFWMKDKNFGLVLNRIFSELPIFGTVVLKVIDGEPHFVDLRNFMVEQSADSLDYANYIIERHLYSAIEFRQVAKKMNWQNQEETLKKHYASKKPYIVVYERYGEVADENGNVSYKRVCMADTGYEEKTQRGEPVPHPGFILEETEIDRHPYWEFHMEKIPGRWLGIGVVETLFDVQVRQNEIANLQAKGSHWSALRVFQTRDEAIARNLLTEIRNGEVLTVDSEITPVAMEGRDLAHFAQETQKWMANRDELTFAYDVIKGERLPAGTPLGSARLAAAMSASYFDQIQENIALRLKEFLYRVIIPRFIRENSSAHYVQLIGEDLETFKKAIIEHRALAEAAQKALSGKFPDNGFLEAVKAAIGTSLKSKKERLELIPKNYYRNLKYKIDIIITGEQRDTAVYAANMFAILQAISADPTMLVDPVKRRILFRIAESSGIRLEDIAPAETPEVEKLVSSIPVKELRAGGGVSAPAFPSQPQPGRVEQVI